MKYRVYLYDIIIMLVYRRDGYLLVFKRVMGEEEKYYCFVGFLLDCSYWCLFGVLDIWNEMFFLIILIKVV